MRALLFDIDGTLIRSDRAGRMALAAALIEKFGSAGGLDSYDMGGKTDARIITDILRSINVPEADIPALLPGIYELMANKALDIYATRDIKPCPGVMALLDALEQEEGVLIALLTGNSPLTAPLKLQAAGIDPARFSFGVYGSEALDRDQLAGLAMTRASQLTGHIFTGDNTVVIGDTPADIQCARAGKATAVSVAGGWHTISDLRVCQPDYLFEDFKNTPVVLAALLGSKGGVMSRRKFDIAGIKFNADKPTAIQLVDLFSWVIWQFPKPQEGGFLGAVCPPNSEPYWIPAIVHPEKDRVQVFAHGLDNYASPEEAVEYFLDKQTGNSVKRPK